MNLHNVILSLVAMIIVDYRAILGDDQCQKMPPESVMTEAQPIAENIMKKCMHLLDKYPVPLNVIGEALKIMCSDYASCHDTFEAMKNDPDKYRVEITKCVRPHLINFCKSRPEIKHDPEALADDIGTCILEHIPLDKALGIATGVWVMKILGIPVE